MGDMEGMDHGHEDGAAAGGDNFAEQRLDALTGYLPQAEINRLRGTTFNRNPRLDSDDRQLPYQWSWSAGVSPRVKGDPGQCSPHDPVGTFSSNPDS